MKRILTTGNAAVIIFAVLATAAMAKEARHHKQTTTQIQTQPHPQAATTGMSNGNAAMGGNNGNSAQGSNAAPNIKGGDAGVSQ